MSVVIDASVALKWVLAEAGADAAAALRSEELIAPALWLVEVANALWRRSLSGEISSVEATERLIELLSAPVTPIPIETDLVAAIALAADLRHPVYDCLYLAAAIREGTHMVTADTRFHAAVASSSEYAGRVRLLA